MIFRFPSTLVLSKRRMCCGYHGKRRCFPITEPQKTHLKLLVGLGYNERHDNVADNLLFSQQEVQ
jgi:CRISPR/Cas system-associated protein endoribonuclease Cas2